MPLNTKRRKGLYKPKLRRDGKWQLQWPTKGLTKSGRQKTRTKRFESKQEALNFAAKVNALFRKEGFKRDSEVNKVQTHSLAISDPGSPKTLYEAGEDYVEAFEASLKAKERRMKRNPSQKKRRANEVLASADENTDTYVGRNTLETKYEPVIRRLCSKDGLGEFPI